MSRSRALGIAVLAITASMAESACSDTVSTARSSCRANELQSAANNVIWFLGDVQQGRDPTITGGVDDPFQCAYDSLCTAQRNRISEDEFRRSEGAAVSDLLTADSWAGPSVYVDRGLAQERPDMDTLDPELDETWVEIEATRYEHIDDRTIVTGSGESEHWRVDLVREDGGWRVCEFAPVTP